MKEIYLRFIYLLNELAEENKIMVISREFIPFIILKQIGDPAYQIFRGAYVSEMGDAEADDLMQSFLERNEALPSQR